MGGSIARWIGDLFLGDGPRLWIGDGTGLLLGRRRLGILPLCLRKGRRDGTCHHDEERCQEHKDAAHGSNYTACRGVHRDSSEKLEMWTLVVLRQRIPETRFHIKNDG